MTKAEKRSRIVSVPSGVSSFFEICDKNKDGSKIKDPLRIGARGGGFIIERGTKTVVLTNESIKEDAVIVNGKLTSSARTTLRVIELLRKEFAIRPVKVIQKVEPPIGTGFGTSGAGALSTAIAISDLFELGLTLSKAADFAHIADVESVTGLGTVISLAASPGSVGLVTEPGSYSVGRVDAILGDYSDYTLICACYAPIEKSTVLQRNTRKNLINKFGRRALESIQDSPTAESLLYHSRIFAEKSGIGTRQLLSLADKAVRMGAVGATQNMIGSSVHCLVQKRKRKAFVDSFRELVPKENLFESDLCPSQNCQT